MSTLSPAARERRLIIRAGIFVAGALSLAALVIFLIGKEGRLFDRQVNYRGAFDDVEGLNLDSPVRLGGLGVGHVTAITFSPDLGDKRIQVHMAVSVRFAERIRADSVARIGSRGVLGDKVIDISLGSADAPRIPPEGEIPTGSSGDITALMKSSGQIMDNVLAITRDLKEGVAAYTHPELRSDVTALLRSARQILEEIQRGGGAAHALVYDRKTAQELTGFLTAAAGTARRLDQAMARVDQLLAEVQQGRGAAHAIFYDPKGAQAISALGSAAGELAVLLHDSRQNSNSAVHQLVYGDNGNLFANLGGAAADLRKITSKIASGEGSLGGIINDPTVYEDLRTILGNVKRNRILRALVRYSISNGEKLEEVGKPEEKK
jgi:phospholipid/cholesterol/gamma-HCH transport system substrate-binding protein